MLKIFNIPLGVWNPFTCPTGLLLHVMGQEHKEYTWNLIAKKLIGEATPKNSGNWRSCSQQPRTALSDADIADLWHTASRQDRKMAELAFNSHLDRMRELKIDFQPAGNPSFPADPAASFPDSPFSPHLPGNVEQG